MTISQRWTSAELDLLPDAWDGTRYEIVEGDLYVSRQAGWHHQFAGDRVFVRLDEWSQRTGLGYAMTTPGVVFAEDDNVIPDVIWISRKRLSTTLGPDGKLHGAPELVVEVLSPGEENERRDREVKRKLYARRGVDEYWIVNPWQRCVERYTRQGGELHLVATLREQDVLESPRVPGFACTVGELFFSGDPR